MSNLWNEVTSWLSDATKSALKETEDLALRGKFRIELLGLNTALHDKFAALGGIVYDLIKQGKTANIKNDAKVKKLVEEIADLELNLRKKQSSTSSKTTVRKQKKSAKPSVRSKSTTKKKSPTARKKVKTSTAKKPTSKKSTAKKPVSKTKKVTKSSK